MVDQKKAAAVILGLGFVGMKVQALADLVDAAVGLHPRVASHNGTTETVAVLDAAMAASPARPAAGAKPHAPAP